MNAGPVASGAQAGIPGGSGEFHFPGPDGELDVDLIADPAGVPRARAMLQRAEWACSWCNG